MICIVGLGNPGKKYKNNRHNVGFMFIDYLVKELTSSRINPFDFAQGNTEQSRSINEFKYDKYSNSQFVNALMNNKKCILIKPQTFMNKSGEAVKKLTNHYSLIPNHLIIVHDDLDIPLGKFKIQKGTGPQLHNGIESIEAHLKTKDFWRVRIGIDNRIQDNGTRPERSRRVNGETYVLRDFILEEKKLLTDKIFPIIFDRLQSVLNH